MPYTNYRFIMEHLILIFMLPLVLGGMLSKTDTITWGGDNSRAGYQPDHGMDPSVVGSPLFGQIFKTLLPGNYINSPEQIYSQPLVYTLNDGIQYVFIATTQNNVYKINAKTGAIVASRSLHVPFLTSDLDGCVDINPTVGVTATGVIDPSTDTWYLTSKTYAPGITQGRTNGRYYFHAIDVNTLNEQPNFPVDLENTPSRNTNGARVFQGGEAHQRPALLQTGQYIYAGFASHCVQYNFTGWIMGWDKTTGQNVEAYAMEGGPEPNTVKGGGVWMSGGGLSSDGQGSLYFATGNGYASQLHGISVPGHSPPSSLEEAAVHAVLNDNGTITIVDFFMPFEKEQLDGADKDLGTTPLELLPTNVFTCPNVKRMGVVTGKSGKTYFLNIDNLGGYQMGPNHGDAVPQVTQNENSVYAGAGVYPGEGGYIYINVIQYPTHVFKFSCDSNGNPAFTHVADSPENNAFILGVGHGTVTSLNGQTGTGLVWTSDVEGSNLRIYNAVPTNGLMTEINSFNIPGVTKFTRPVFGDARAYIGTTLGFLYGFGSPVNLPLNCSSPYQFGTVVIGSQSNSTTISCQANTNLQITSATLAGNKNFIISNVPQMPVTLQAGANFTFTAVFAPTSPGPLSSDILVNTTATGYSPNTPISLKGTGESLNPVLGVSPNTVSFTGVITGQQPGGVNASAIFLNQGDGNLTITSIDYSVVAEGGVTVKPNITSLGIQVGPFTFINMPTTIAGKSQVTIGINFNPTFSGNFAVYMTIHSNGGTKIFDVVATSGTFPKALVEFQAADGSGKWIPYSNTSSFSFGTVLEQQTRTLKMRLSNVGDKNAGQLSVTVSKPPFGVPGIINAVNGVDLAEGTTIAANSSATADLYCSVPKSQVNTDSYNGTAQWTLNTGDPTLGKLFIQFSCTAASPQVGPLAANGSATYRYDFCAVENNPGRQLSNRLYVQNDNSNDECITACAAAGYKYCGTQYQVECWAGNSVPIASSLERDCNYACMGNNNETCGGNGFFNNGTFISLFVNPALPEGAANPVGGGGGGPAPTSFKNPATIGAFSSLGCYTEATTGKALVDNRQDNDPAMTLEWCATQMAQYNYFGVEYGQECYGGNILQAGAVPTASTDCSFPCPGNSTESCGAGNRLQMYGKNTTGITTSTATGMATGTATSGTSTIATTSGVLPKATTTTVPMVAGAYTFVGCYSESTGNARALTGASNFSSKSVDNCAAFCTANGATKFFGIEYYGQCFCGNSLDSTSVPSTGCNYPCDLNSTQVCGGNGVLDLYELSNLLSTTTSTTATPTPTAPATVQKINGWSYTGCYTEGTNGRALSGLENPVPGSNNSIEACGAACSGFQYFGVEYSAECYCGNTLGAGSVVAPGGSDVTQNSCNMLCSGNQFEYCGGPNRLDIYSSIPSNTSSSATVTSTTISGSSSVITTSATPTPTGPVTVQKLSGWTYLACYTEGTSDRALNGLLDPVPGANNSVEACGAACSGYKYFGVEYGAECYCGNSFTTGAVVAAGGSDPNANGCSVVCAGNQNEYCGGPNRLNVYLSSPSSTSSSATVTSTTITSTTSATPTPTGPVTVQTLSGWTYLACYTEGTNDRALNGLLDPVPGANNSVEACGAACSGFKYFGVEYGAECYCGNFFTPGAVVAAGGSDPNANGCSVVCAGNQNEYCGGGNRLNVYQNATKVTSTSTSKSTSTLISTTATSSTASTSSVSTTTSTSATPTPTGPQTVQTLSGYQYLGCYTEATNNRALSDLQNPIVGANVSVEKCATACVSYTYFGVEYGGECYCGNTINAGSVLAPGGNDTTQNGCSVVCQGNQNEYCGGGNRLNMYKVKPVTSSKTSTTSTSSSTSISIATKTSTSASSSIASTSKTSTATSTVVSSSASTSTKASTSTALTSTTTISSSTPSKSSTPSTTSLSSTSKATSASSTSLSTSKATSTSSTTSTTSQSSTKTLTVQTSTSISATTTSSAPVTTTTSANAGPPTPTVAALSEWSSQGCYTEGTTTRALSSNAVVASNMTAEYCASIARGNYLYFGLEFGSECYMGNAFAPGSVVSTVKGDCATTCSGNATEICGGASRLTVYKASQAIAPVMPSVLAGNKEFKYYNCVNEPSAGRALSTLLLADDGMTVEKCLGLATGMKYAGVEYGRECWADSTLNTAATNATAPAGAATPACGMTCMGNKGEYCGDQNRLTVYINNGTASK